MPRDEFTQTVKDTLAKRVGFRCSFPECGQLTSGPQTDANKALNVGVASHITAASPAGPRYDPSLTQEGRCSATNGIWLCQTHGKLVDNDVDRYTAGHLRRWRDQAEARALQELERRIQHQPANVRSALQKAEQRVPGLLGEMRTDLADHPLYREFVLLKKGWSFWAGSPSFAYYYEDHPDLDAEVRLLQNLGLIEDITHTNVKRFLITEEFADYLQDG